VDKDKKATDINEVVPYQAELVVTFAVAPIYSWYLTGYTN